MINAIIFLDNNNTKVSLKFPPSSTTPRNSLPFETMQFKEADRAECIQRKVIKMGGKSGKVAIQGEVAKN